MERVWQQSAKVLTGFLVAAMYAMPQATISARPGAINYIEGHAYIDGHEISQKSLGRTMLDPNQKLSTDLGKAEVLLTPGVFLRIGENSEVRMISLSLAHIQLEVTRGEAVIEVAELYKGSDIEILNHGGSVTLEKVGVYRVNADEPPSIGVYDGRAEVAFGTRKVDLKKGHEVLLADKLQIQKFDRKKADDLYAWSNIRAEYDASASYSTAKNVYTNSLSGYNNGYGYDTFGYNSYGYGAFNNPGWYWNSGFNSWAWLPGAYAFSPFGWGFYSPGYVSYASTVYAPVLGGGGVISRPVPVNPLKPPTGSNGVVLPRGPSGVPSAAPSPGRITSAQASQVRSTAIARGPALTSGGGGGGRSSGASSAQSAPRMASAPSSSGGHSGGTHK